MNQKALENRAYVRNLILAKQPALARILAELTHTPLNQQSEHFSRAEGGGVVGFGACQTDRYPSSSAEEWELS